MAEFDPIAFNLENAERHLLGYLPPFLQQVQEFQAVNAANEPEIKAAWQSLYRVLGNQFLAEADGQGLAIWERELGILAKDTDSLSLRRARIKAAWQRQPPYTLRWLRGWLDEICGDGNYTLNVQDYTISILLDYERVREPSVLLRDILAFLGPVRPAHMLLETVEVMKPQRFILHIGGALFGNISSTELPQLVWEQPMQQQISLAAQSENIMQTDLPQLAWRQDFAENIFAAADMSNMSETKLPEMKG